VTVLLVALGAALGAPLRYLTDLALQSRLRSAFPWGTLAVNVTGSLILGLVVGLPVPPAVAALAGTGFCGALTTYSTFGFETLRLARAGLRRHAVVNVLGSVAAGLAAAYLGILLAGAVT
jgi:CrcB protein